MTITKDFQFIAPDAIDQGDIIGKQNIPRDLSRSANYLFSLATGKEIGGGTSTSPYGHNHGMGAADYGGAPIPLATTLSLGCVLPMIIGVYYQNDTVGEGIYNLPISTYVDGSTRYCTNLFGTSKLIDSATPADAEAYTIVLQTDESGTIGEENIHFVTIEGESYASACYPLTELRTYATTDKTVLYLYHPYDNTLNRLSGNEIIIWSFKQPDWYRIHIPKYYAGQINAHINLGTAWVNLEPEWLGPQATGTSSAGIPLNPYFGDNNVSYFWEARLVVSDGATPNYGPWVKIDRRFQSADDQKLKWYTLTNNYEGADANAYVRIEARINSGMDIELIGGKTANTVANNDISKFCLFTRIGATDPPNYVIFEFQM